MDIGQAGDRGLLVTLPQATAARLRSVADGMRAIDGVLAAIIGHSSVYVIGTSDREAVERVVESSSDARQSSSTLHIIEVSFAPEHGLDFDALVARAQVSREAIIERIAALTLTVRYLGFRGGFGYLEGWPEEWSLPRRATSRNVVPGGSFAIAGVMAGFYPDDSPGGWNILGRSDRVPRLKPGDEVRIVPIERALQFITAPAKQDSGEAIVDVIAPGQLTTVVHAREWSRLEEGEPAGGPFDEELAALANDAAGNAADAPLLECVLVGPRLRFRDARRVAWCGASCEPRVWEVRAGEEIDIARIRDGLRGYLAVEGGVSGFGKMLLRGGGFSRTDRLKPVHTQNRLERLSIRVMPGPHDAPPLPIEWVVTPNINRVGIRLRCVTPTEFKPPAELPSCGMQFGTIQWHPDGSIVVMGPDHPATGGYLQPATVRSSELWKLAQLAPGERVRLVAE